MSLSNSSALAELWPTHAEGGEGRLEAVGGLGRGGGATVTLAASRPWQLPGRALSATAGRSPMPLPREDKLILGHHGISIHTHTFAIIMIIQPDLS